MIDTRDYGRIIAKNLKKIMFESGKTQADMSRDLGIGKTTISAWMNGAHVPRMDKIDLLCDYFGCKRSDIMEDPAVVRDTLSVSDEQAALVQLALKARPENVALVLNVLRRLEGKK